MTETTPKPTNQKDQVRTYPKKGCHSRPTAAFRRLSQRCDAAFALRPFVHCAAFWRIKRRSADKTTIRCMMDKGLLFTESLMVHRCWNCALGGF
jgi:hypothetical protein